MRRTGLDRRLPARRTAWTTRWLAGPQSRGSMLALCVALRCLGACDSNTETVCSDIANCSHGGSDDWYTACSDQTSELLREADQSGCGKAFDAYFACAERHFDCQGNQSRFAGCEAALDALTACFGGARSKNACGELDDTLNACPGATPEAEASGTSATPLEACTPSGVCSARCYLDTVGNVCTPSAAGLEAFAECASHCIP